LRLIKLDNANLEKFIKPCFEISATSNIDVVLGGYGQGRGYILSNDGVVYGYLWDGSDNFTLRWGTNKINNLFDFALTLDFDGLNEGNSTTYESGLAYYDSGCGIFVKQESEWRVIGLGRSVSRVRKSFFRHPRFTFILYPDSIEGVNLISNFEWISEKIVDNCNETGDINDDGDIDIIDLSLLSENWLKSDCDIFNNYCNCCDINRDEIVNFLDYAEVLKND